MKLTGASNVWPKYSLERPSPLFRTCPHVEPHAQCDGESGQEPAHNAQQKLPRQANISSDAPNSPQSQGKQIENLVPEHWHMPSVLTSRFAVPLAGSTLTMITGFWRIVQFHSAAEEATGPQSHCLHRAACGSPASALLLLQKRLDLLRGQRSAGHGSGGGFFRREIASAQSEGDVYQADQHWHLD